MLLDENNRLKVIAGVISMSFLYDTLIMRIDLLVRFLVKTFKKFSRQL